MQTRSITNPLPAFYIGKDLTAERIGNYSSKHALLSNAIGKSDTYSVWYSRDHIVKLLEEIDYAEGDGLRIFLGSYESNHADYADQTCLLMVVTREQTEGNLTIHKNVIAEEEADFTERGALPKGVLNYGDSSFGRKKDYNHGSPCPPLCDGGSGPGFP